MIWFMPKLILKLHVLIKFMKYLILTILSSTMNTYLYYNGKLSREDEQSLINYSGDSKLLKRTEKFASDRLNACER